MTQKIDEAIEECLERLDYTRAQLENQLTEVRGLVLLRAKQDHDSPCVLGGLSGHLLGMAIVAMRIDGLTDDDMRILLHLTLEA